MLVAQVWIDKLDEVMAPSTPKHSECRIEAPGEQPPDDASYPNCNTMPFFGYSSCQSLTHANIDAFQSKGLTLFMEIEQPLTEVVMDRLQREESFD